MRHVRPINISIRAPSFLRLSHHFTCRLHLLFSLSLAIPKPVLLISFTNWKFVSLAIFVGTLLHHPHWPPPLLNSSSSSPVAGRRHPHPISTCLAVAEDYPDRRRWMLRAVITVAYRKSFAISPHRPDWWRPSRSRPWSQWSRPAAAAAPRHPNSQRRSRSVRLPLYRWFEGREGEMGGRGGRMIANSIQNSHI